MGYLLYICAALWAGVMQDYTVAAILFVGGAIVFAINDLERNTHDQ